MPTTQETDGFQVKRPGDLNVKCTLLLMLDHQVTGAMSQGQGQVYCKPFLSLPYSVALVFHKNPSFDFLLSPASSVQVGPPTGKAAGSAHTDKGRHHAGPVALHQTQPAAGRA